MAWQWPIRSRLRATSSILLRLLLDSHLLMFGRSRRSAQSGSLCHLACHSSRISQLKVDLSSLASTLSDGCVQSARLLWPLHRLFHYPEIECQRGWVPRSLMSPLSKWILVRSCRALKTSDEETIWPRSAITELAESVTMRQRL